MSDTLLGIKIDKTSKSDILDKIKKYRFGSTKFFHIVSLNPENITLAQKNVEFKKVLNEADVKLIDGFGTVLAGKILGVQMGARFTGVDLMKTLIEEAQKQRSGVVLIGGKAKIAEYLADCYSRGYSKASFYGLEGIKNIKNPLKEEERKILSIVAGNKPRFVFIAFGSPHQELWIYKNRERFKGVICMGVGGGFDFLTGQVRRAPRFLRKIGLEWAFRLIIQPWRLKRQLRLITFGLLVFKDKFMKIHENTGKRNS